MKVAISTSDTMLLANATEVPNPITNATAKNNFFMMQMQLSFKQGFYTRAKSIQ